MKNPLLAVLVLPAVEIGLLALFAGRFGLTALAAEVFGTSLVGLYLVRRSGARSLVEANARLQAAQESPEQVLDDLMRAVAGLLLMIPGIATDLVGLLLLLPAARRGLVRRWVDSGRVYRYGAGWHPQHQGRSAETPHAGPRQGRRNGAAGNVIEGEFTRED